MRRWLGVWVRCTGKATIMHARRGEALAAATGAEVSPGTLNLDLDQDFAWGAPHREAEVPDAEDWGDLGGPWATSTARLWPVWVSEGGQCLPGWVMRLDRSRAPLHRVELIAAVSVRAMLGDGPYQLELRT